MSRQGPGSDRRHGPYTVPYGGRWVTLHWWRTFSGMPRKPRDYTKAPGKQKPDPIPARFFLPAIHPISEPAEIRIVNLSDRDSRDFVQEMTEAYASMFPETEITTFFK